MCVFTREGASLKNFFFQNMTKLSSFLFSDSTSTAKKVKASIREEKKFQLPPLKKIWSCCFLLSERFLNFEAPPRFQIRIRREISALRSVLWVSGNYFLSVCALSFVIWAFPSHFWDFIFSWFIVLLQLTNFVNGDRKQERKRKKSIIFLIL